MSIPRSMRTKGWRVTKTTRLQGSGGAIELSMEQVASAGPPNLEQYDAVVVAAAVTAQAACESAAENACLVNVEAPKMLARAAMDAGSHVVFLSTNLVLGGGGPFLGTAAPLAPVGAYARMKAEAERTLQALPGDIAPDEGTRSGTAVARDLARPRRGWRSRNRVQRLGHRAREPVVCR